MLLMTTKSARRNLTKATQPPQKQKKKNQNQIAKRCRFDGVPTTTHVKTTTLAPLGADGRRYSLHTSNTMRIIAMNVNSITMTRIGRKK